MSVSQSAAARSPSGAPPASIFLLLAYAALSSAMQQMERDLAAGIPVRVFVFNPALHKFLQPLAARHVEVTPALHSIHVGVYRFWTWLPRMFATRRWLRGLLGKVTGSTIYFYNDSFHLPLLAAVAFLARQNGNRLVFEDWDHTRATGLDQRPCRSSFLRVLGALSGWIIGAPVLMLDPTKPFACLRPAFYERHGVERRTRSSDTLAEGRKLPLAETLVRQSKARVVWLWDDLPRFYGPQKVAGDAYYRMYGQLFAQTSAVVPPAEQAVKPHPYLDGVELPIFAGCEMLPAWVPMEFMEFTRPAIAITIASHAMKRFLDQGFPVISLAKMLQASPEVMDEQDRALRHWIEAGDRLHLPASLDEFTAILRALTAKGGEH